MVNPITGTIPEAMHTTTNMLPTSNKMQAMTGKDFVQDEPEDGFLLYIIIGVVVILILLVIALLFFIILVRKNKKGKTDQHHAEKNLEEENVSNSQQQQHHQQQQEDINANSSPTYAMSVKNKHVIGDVSHYSVSNVIQIDTEADYDDDADKGEEFYNAGVTEYGIPVAFRRDAFGEHIRQREDDGEYAFHNVVI